MKEITSLDQFEDPPVPQSQAGRWLYAGVTILLPIISFAIVSRGVFSPWWQSGRTGDYVAIMLHWEVLKFFSPFIAYSLLSMLLFLLSDWQSSELFLVRLGIYTGVILAVQYTIFLLAIFWPGLPLYVLIPIGVFLLALSFGISRLYSASKEYGVDKVWWVVGGLVLCLGLMGLVTFWLPLTAGPFLCFMIGSSISAWFLRNRRLFQHRAWHGLAVLAWIYLFIRAWQAAVSETVYLYSQLPESPPQCYLATAAARGHPRWVKSAPVVMIGGRTVWVNPQLRYFKCAELVLLALSPRIHGACRMLYDRLGARLARWIVHPLVADGVYLALKPVEWTFRFLIKAFFPGVDELAHRIYRSIT